MADVELATLGTPIRTALTGVDGAGSGVDADMLDGQHASAFATAAQGALAQTALQSGGAATTAQGALADSALQPGDIASGTITARTGAVNFSGGADGHVWTVQADGSVAFEAPQVGGGGGTWGTIGGNINDQADLAAQLASINTALDGKATAAQGAKADTALQPASIIPMANVAAPTEPTALNTVGPHALSPASHNHRVVRALPQTAAGEVAVTVANTASDPFGCELVHDEASGIASLSGTSLRSSVGFAVPWNPLATKLFMTPFSVFNIRRHASGRVFVNGPARQLTPADPVDPEALNGVGGVSVIGWDLNRSTIATVTGISSISTRVASGHDLTQATGANQPTQVGTPNTNDNNYGARFVDSTDTIGNTTATEMPLLGKNYCLLLVCRLTALPVSENNIITLGDGTGPAGNQVLIRIVGSQGNGLSAYIYNSSFQTRGTTLPATAFDGRRLILVINVNDVGDALNGTVKIYAFHEVLGYIVRTQPNNITFSASGNTGKVMTIRYVIPWTLHAFYRLNGVVSEAVVEQMMRFFVNDWMADVGAI